jgi:ubiquinone biosynthesis protein COQ9
LSFPCGRPTERAFRVDVVQAHPFNAASALRQRAALVDEIWHAAGAADTVFCRSQPAFQCFFLTLWCAGDKSSDLSWYSKRATLAAVYAATELFMITGACCSLASELRGRAVPHTHALTSWRRFFAPHADVSPEFEDTWTFLERRISGIMEAGKVVNEVSQARAAHRQWDAPGVRAAASSELFCSRRRPRRCSAASVGASTVA